jgi:hypothetical protein
MCGVFAASGVAAATDNGGSVCAPCIHTPFDDDESTAFAHGAIDGNWRKLGLKYWGTTSICAKFPHQKQNDSLLSGWIENEQKHVDGKRK